MNENEVKKRIIMRKMIEINKYRQIDRKERKKNY